MPEHEMPERIIVGQDIIDDFISMEVSNAVCRSAKFNVRRISELQRVFEQIEALKQPEGIDDELAKKVGLEVLSAAFADELEQTTLDELEQKHSESLSRVHRTIQASVGRPVVVEVLDDEAFKRSGISYFNSRSFSYDQNENLREASGLIIESPSSHYALGITPSRLDKARGDRPRYTRIKPASVLVENDPTSVVPNVNIYFDD